MPDSNKSEVRVVTTSCLHDCGGRCILQVHVKEGRVIRIESDTAEEPQLRACLRGRAYRQRLYDPQRLMHPLKRVGERGEGQFERVSWDEALDTVASQLKRIKETYGSSALLFIGGGGCQGPLHGRWLMHRLLAAFGGYTTNWGAPSFEGSLFASMATFGTMLSGHTFDDLLNSRLIILWGLNPASSIWDTNTSFYLAQAKEAGSKIVALDPRLTGTVATFATKWIAPRPGTDTALLIAMAYVIIQENLQDQGFLDTYTVGFAQFKDYVTGVEDGIPKTPLWAGRITGVPAAVIEKLARDYATTKPAALIPGWAPARTAYGEQFARAASTLAAMTGNIGVHGSFAGGFMRPYPSMGLRLPFGARNSVEQGTEKRQYALSLRGGANPTAARIHTSKIYDAILQGQDGGYPTDVKMVYTVSSDFLNSYSNVNRGIEALKCLEFMVTHEHYLSPTAKFADIVLPVNTFLERRDIARPWLGAPYYIYMEKAVESLGETKSEVEIYNELASRLGLTPEEGSKTEEDWLEVMASARKDIPSYEELKRKGALKIQLPEPVVAFREQIQGKKPFPTPSGKIEIYSQLLADMNNPELPPVPKYLDPIEGPNSSLKEKYPLQLITSHPKNRTHSSLNSVPWLIELEPHTLWINPADAEARGIKNGEPVMAFNDRGKTVLPAQLTERIRPGVVDIQEGAWYDPDEKGVDRGGSANVLTQSEHSPGGANQYNTCLVQVQKL